MSAEDYTPDLQAFEVAWILYAEDLSVNDAAGQALRGLAQIRANAVSEAVGAFVGGGWHEAYDRANLPQTHITRTAMNVVDNWFEDYAARIDDDQ